MENPSPDNPFAKDARSAIFKILTLGFIDWYEGGLTKKEEKDLNAAGDELLAKGAGFLVVEAMKPQPPSVVQAKPIGPITFVPRAGDRIYIHHNSSV